MIGSQATYCAAIVGVSFLFVFQDDPASRLVYIVGHGWHTGIAVKICDIPDGLLPEKDAHPQAMSMEFGWGDADFYMDPEAGASQAINAALSSDSSVIHVVWFAEPIEQYFPTSDIVEMRISTDSFTQLCLFLHRTFARDSAGTSTVLRPGYYPVSSFYRSGEHYDLLNTCNVWTARALRAAGFPLIPVFYTTAGSILGEAERYGKVVR